VFGEVMGGNMSALDAINALSQFTTHGFMNVPLQNYSLADQLAGVDVTSHLVMFNGVSVVKTHPSFQNPITPGDVNNDGVVSPIDQLYITNYLASHGPHALTAADVGSNFLYYDINGDGQVSNLDLVPEPASAWLASLGLVGLWWCRRRMRGTS
jgi:hypothetical protein